MLAKKQVQATLRMVWYTLKKPYEKKDEWKGYIDQIDTMLSSPFDADSENKLDLLFKEIASLNGTKNKNKSFIDNFCNFINDLSENLLSQTSENLNFLSVIETMQAIVSENKSMISSSYFELLPATTDITFITSLPFDIWKIVFSLMETHPAQLVALLENSFTLRKYWHQINVINNCKPENMLQGSGFIATSRKQVLKGNGRIKFFVVCKDGSFVSGSGKGELIHWRWNLEKSNFDKVFLFNEKQNSFKTGYLCRDGSLLCTLMDKRLLYFQWDGKKFEKYKLLNMQQYDVTCVIQCASNNSLVTAANDDAGTLIQWQWNSHHNNYEEKAVLLSNGFCFSVIECEDGSLISTVGNDLLHFGLNSDGSYTLKTTLKGHTDDVFSIKQCEDNSLLSASGDGKLIHWVWDQAKESFIMKTKLEGHSGQVFSVINCRDGSSVSASGDGSLIHWNFHSEKNSFELKNHLSRHSDEVHNVIQLRDNSLVSVSNDHTLIRWRWHEGQRSFKYESTLSGHDNWVSQVVECHNGSLISAGGECLIIWPKVFFNDLFIEAKKQLKLLLQETLSRKPAQNINTNFDVEEAKLFLRMVLKRLPSFFTENPFLDENSIKIFMGAYCYLLTKNTAYAASLPAVFKPLISLPIIALYKDEVSECISSFKSFLFESKDLPKLLEEVNYSLNMTICENKVNPSS